jgi:hypothetical protein
MGEIQKPWFEFISHFYHPVSYDPIYADPSALNGKFG